MGIVYISTYVPEEIDELLRKEADAIPGIRRKNGKGNKSVVIRQILISYFQERGKAGSDASLCRVHPGKPRKEE